MYYSAIGLIAIMILLIENQDILLNRKRAFDRKFWKVYRIFLFTILVYYITDILWGILESQKLDRLLFADTSCYFIVMAVGILFWTNYVVTYLEDQNRFGRFLVFAGRITAILVSVLTVVNFFVPIFFRVDEDCVYFPLVGRYVILTIQILLLLLISIYAISSIFWRHYDTEESQRYRTMALFGLIMATFLIAQLCLPYLPLYTIAYMLGTCLLRAFVIGDEKEKYRSELEEVKKIKDLKQSISALLDNMPALSFSKDAKTGAYLACNQAFAEYAHKDNPEQVIGLTDAQIFDQETASHFEQDDRMALSMETPYIFFEDVPDAAGNQRQFQTTKLKFVDASGRLCMLGMSQDVTDMVRIQRENATTKEEYERAQSMGLIYAHIAQTLARGYTDLYYVDLETEEYMEYHMDDEFGMLIEVERGKQFFELCRQKVAKHVYPEDQDSLNKALERDTLLKAISRNKTFIITFRYLLNQETIYFSLRASRMKIDERFLILGLANVDEEMKQRRIAEQIKEEHNAYARLNALTGDFLCVYIVDPKTDRYREFSATEGFGSFELPKEGKDFYAASREQVRRVIYPDDLERFLSLFTKESVLTEIESLGIFVLSYRLLFDGKPRYVQLKATKVEEKDGIYLIVGINDIDAHIRQEQEYARRLDQVQRKADMDALTGVKNKHAYLDEEGKLERQIEIRRDAEFAIVIMDVNDLKKINDTYGHQAGDQYIRDACRIICETFEHSPVFRIGGDEFAVIVQGDDYMRIDELIGQMNDHNMEASRTGEVVIACGMAKYENDACVASVFERADQNMYENKNFLKHRGHTQ